MFSTAAPLSYAIIGTGAIGGYYGARLQQAGCEVHFLLRSDYTEVQQAGLKVESIEGDFYLPQVSAYPRAAQMPPVDVAIVALKTTHNAKLPQLLPPLKPQGAILSLQNGLDIEAGIAQHLTAACQPVPTLLGGLCFICANKVGPGHIRHLDYGRVLLGAHDPARQPCPPTPLMERIAADFSRAQVPIALTEDLPLARWQKLVWNVPYNGLSVVLDATTEAMMANREVRSLITTLMEEVVAVANGWAQEVSPGSGRHIADGAIAQMLAHTETMAPYRTSMKIDYDEGRPLEIEAILGNPVRTAQAVRVAAPAMTMLYQQLSFLNRQKLQPSVV